MKKVLITGAAGFVGFHLATALSRRGGYELTLVDNLVRGRQDGDFAALLGQPGVEFRTADLSSPDSFRELGDGFDQVYHLAAIIGVKNVMQRPWDVVRVNALTTLHLLDWACAGGARKVLFSSTSEAYAWTQQFHELPIPTPEDVPVALTDLSNPRSSYAGSKVFGELAITHACTTAGLPFVITRYHNVYGPRMGFDHVIPELFARASGGENPLVVYSADHSRAFCYVSDAIAATVAAMESGAADGATINVGNDDEVSIGDLARAVLDFVDPSADTEPKVAAHDPIRRRCPDISRARQLIGYEPQVPLREGLERTIEWYRGHLQDAR